MLRGLQYSILDYLSIYLRFGLHSRPLSAGSGDWVGCEHVGTWGSKTLARIGRHKTGGRGKSLDIWFCGVGGLVWAPSGQFVGSGMGDARIERYPTPEGY